MLWNESDLREVREYISEFVPVFHNAKFDIRALASIGIEVDWSEYEDTLLASHAFNSREKHGLKELAYKYLEYPTDDEDTLKKRVRSARLEAKKLGWTLGEDEKGSAQLEWDYWMPYQIDDRDDSCSNYALSDVERTILLWSLYKDVLEVEGLLEVYEQEKELQRVLYKVEDCGLSIHKPALYDTLEFFSQEHKKQLDKLDWITTKLFNEKVNVNSSPKMQDLVYGKDKFNLPIRKKTAKGKPALDSAALQDLFSTLEDGTYAHKYIKHLLTSKAYLSGGRYLKSYIKQLFDLDEDFGVLYSSINQSGTATSRVSTSNPNGQNIGKKSQYKIGTDKIQVPKLREVFCPVPGKVWYSLDYSQIELRVFSVISQEQSLIDALNAGYDFHGYVASRIYNKSLDAITEQERTVAKNVNFALIFGATERKVDLTAGMVGAYKLFAGQFPNVANFMKLVIEQVQRDGYVETLDGYRLTVPRDKAYIGVNYKVQGTAGRIIKKAMIDIDKYIDWDSWKMMFQIHDELLFEVDKYHINNNPGYVQGIVDIMEDAGRSMGVNTPVSCEIIEHNWGNPKEIELEVVCERC